MKMPQTTCTLLCREFVELTLFLVSSLFTSQAIHLL